jgi:alpha(1,3/1,4) fucosyltransferase
MKPDVKIRFVNFFPGFDEAQCRSNVLMDLCDEFNFVFCDDADILLVNCYGQQQIPAVGRVRIGYYTENLAPDLRNFDYFFGCEYTPLINDPRYRKRVFGDAPTRLFDGCSDPAAALAAKTEFANFIYSARVPHRERFFCELNDYKPVRSPGKAMNNCEDLSSRASSDWQSAKLAYLRKFKFTVAFENSCRAGYHTEKLYDAFIADTVPIYWGDPALETMVNPEAVIRVEGDWEGEVLPWLSLPDLRDPHRPYFRKPGLLNKVTGRLNDRLTDIRRHYPYKAGFDAAIEQVRALDRDDEAYLRKLAQPRLKKDAVMSIRNEYFSFWRDIISQVTG